MLDEIKQSVDENLTRENLQKIPQIPGITAEQTIATDLTKRATGQTSAGMLEDLANLSPFPEKSETFVQTNLLHKLTDLQAKAHTDVDGFVYFDLENSDPAQLLDWATVNGNYVFHGTSRKINEDLKPRQANDTEKESGNRNAVYMTNKPALAEFTALTGGTQGYRENTCTMDIDDTTHEISYANMVLKVENPDQIQNEGFVYIFNKNTQVDEKANGEYLAYRQIEPLAVLKVKKDQFHYPIEVKPRETLAA